MKPQQQGQQQPSTALDNELLKTGLPSLSLHSRSEKSYHGIRRPDGSCEVRVEEPKIDNGAENSGVSSRPLPLCLELRNHSPSGFAWGYGGSGPAQLALALLMDVTGDRTLALRHYQEFKFRFVAGWGESWKISRDEITSFLEAQENPASCQRA